MGYSCIAKPGFWSSFSNPALLVYQKQLKAGINFENRFNLKELGTRTAGIIFPAGKTTLGAVYSNFGYRYFSRHTAGVSCGMFLTQKLAAGIQVEYFNEHTPGEYSEQNSLSFEAGVSLGISDKTTFGFTVFNLVPASLRKSWLPSRLQVGTEITLNRSFSATAEAGLTTGGNVRISFGFEYSILTAFKVSGGFSSGNNSFCFGLGYKIKSLKIDLGFAVHDRLGITSSASLIFEIMK